MIKLYGLSSCLLYAVFCVTVLYVVCYMYVSMNSNNIRGYVYNRELITQPTPITLIPRQIQILEFFSQTHNSGGVIKNILVSIICVTFNLDTCTVSFLNYL